MATPKKKSIPAGAGEKTRIRRRRRSGTVTKVSFSLQTDVVNAIRLAVREGRAESASAFVDEAIRAHLRGARRQALHQSYAEAGRDPAFTEDVDDMARAFDTTVADGLPKRRR